VREFKTLSSAWVPRKQTFGAELGRENFGPRIASPPSDAKSPLSETHEPQQQQQKQQTICRRKMTLCETYAYLALTQKAILTVWTEQKLKASLWFSIGKIVDEETLRLNTNATPQFIGALTEMVWSQIGITPSVSERIIQC
jgi:hypothetical protein